MNIFGGNNYPPPKRNMQSQMDYLVPPSIFSPSNPNIPSNITSNGVSPLSYGPPPVAPVNTMRNRIWIKRPNKTPTTLFVGPNDIIDDLKSQVMMKFPTSLAIQADPSDLIIKLEIPSDLSPSGPGFKQSSNHSPSVYTPNAMNSNKRGGVDIPQKMRSATPMNLKDPLPSSSVPVSPIPVSSFKSVLLSNSISEDATNKAYRSEIVSGPSPANNQSESSVVNGYMTLVLEPDALVWKILDTYFPQGMKMSDALIVQSPYQEQQRRVTATNKSVVMRGSNSEMVPIDPNNSEFSPYYYNSITPNLQQHMLQLDHNGYGYYNAINKTAIIGEQKLPSPRDYTKFRKYSQRTPDPGSSTSGTVLLLPKGHKSASVSAITQGKTYTGGNDKFNIHRIEENYSPEPQSNVSPIPNNNDNHTGDTNRSRLNNEVSSASVEQADTQSPPKPIIPPAITPAPLQKKASTKDFSKTAVANILSNINVLVVEDNLVNQKIMSRYLKSCSVRYKIASTGKEAIEMWREGGFHLVFMDIQLPVMSGMEVTQEIRRLERLNRIGNFAETPNQIEDIRNLNDVLDLSLFRSPIIIVALTASTSQADKQNALAAGCNDYLTKPVQLKWLRSKLNEWGCMQALINYDHFKNSD